MAAWDPALYARFEADRQRPAQELLSRTADGPVYRAVDLGCGSGISTELLARRFPGAELAGLDTSAPMLEAARKRLPGADFYLRDVATWSDPRCDLIFSNAVLHWVPGHIDLMGRWAQTLPAGGRLAAQMPDNENEPTHILMRKIARRPRFAAKLAAVGETRATIGAFSDYDAVLAPHCGVVDIWRTTYAHRLPGPDAIVAWVEGAGLRPYLEPLDADERAEFLATYREEIARAYPVRAWGGVILPFPRLFVVAMRT